MCEAEGAHAGGVDDPATLGQRERDSRGGGVAAAAGDVVDPACGAIGSGHEGIDESRLADAGLPDEHGHLIAQVVAHGIEVCCDGSPVISASDGDGGHVEGGVGIDHRLRIGEIGLGEDEQRCDPGVVRRHECTIDKAEPRLGIGQRGDDRELIGIGDDDALDRIGVISGAAQDGGAMVNAHDACKVVDTTASAREGDPVADDHTLAPELARLDREHDDALVGGEGEATAVDGDHHRRRGIGVSRAVLGPRA